MSRIIIVRKPVTSGESSASRHLPDNLARKLNNLERKQVGGIVCVTPTKPPKNPETSIALDKEGLESLDGLRDVAGEITVEPDDPFNSRRKPSKHPFVSGRDPEKPFGCTQCDYNGKTLSTLTEHVRSRHSEHARAFSCDYCDYVCNYDKNMRHHLESRHFEENPFACDHCELKFPKYFLLKEHKAETFSENVHVCNTCQYRCNSEYRLETHMKTHDGSKTYHCDFCEFNCSNRLELRRHVVTQHGLTPYSCQYCDFKSCHPSALKNHMYIHTGEKPYACDNCEYRTVTRTNLKHHIMMVHTNEKPFACDLCDYKTARKHHLRLHKMTHAQEKPHACSYCSFRSITKTKLNEHMRAHTGEKPYACEYCEYRATRKDYLDSHKRQHTGVPSKPRKPRQPYGGLSSQAQARAVRRERYFTCKVCDYRVTRKADLDAHMKRHASKRPVASRINVGGAEDCLAGLFLDNSDNTDDHSEDQFEDVIMSDIETDALEVLAQAARAAEISMPSPKVPAQTQTKPKPKATLDKGPDVIVVGTEGGVITGVVPEPADHVCGWCNFASTTSRALKQHVASEHAQIKTAEKAKSFVCELCGYSTARKNHLAVHKLTHTGEKQFACEYCDYKTATQTRLNIHKRAHTGEKPYACDYCEYRATRKDYLDSHLRQHVGGPSKPRPRKQRQNYSKSSGKLYARFK